MDSPPRGIMHLLSENYTKNNTIMTSPLPLRQVNITQQQENVENDIFHEIDFHLNINVYSNLEHYKKGLLELVVQDNILVLGRVDDSLKVN